MFGRDVVLGTRSAAAVASAAVALALGAFAAAPASDATPLVVGWGNGNIGALGDGSEAAKDLPTPVIGLEAVTALSGLDAVLPDGEVDGWGPFSAGFLGVEEVEGCFNPCLRQPRDVPELNGVTAVASGIALLPDGHVETWGANKYGKLGLGSEEGPESCEGEACSRHPVEVPGLEDVRAVAGRGSAHHLVALEDGTVRAWGENAGGQLGDGTTMTHTAPERVEGLSGVTDVAESFQQSEALRADGAVLVWGKLGGDRPVQVPGISTAVAISGGDLVLLADGHVLGVEDVFNSKGQLTGVKATEVPGVSGAVAISGTSPTKEFPHGMALLGDGRVVDWGENGGGELGDGRTVAHRGASGVCGLSGVTIVGNAFDAAFAYLPEGEPARPAVDGLSAYGGPLGGGETVTIAGKRLGDVETVRFGSTSVPFKVLSETAIETTSPAGSGTVDVTVTSPEGTSVTCAGDEFSFVAPPTVKKVTPKNGSAAGGLQVTILGSGYTEVQEVRFGPAGTKSVFTGGASAGKLQVTVPPDSAGKLPVVVVNAGSPSAVGHATVKLAGAISSISPNHGPLAGGTPITVKGIGFAPGATTFEFGKALKATSVVCSSYEQCTLQTPASTNAGSATVTAEEPYKGKETTTFTYE